MPELKNSEVMRHVIQSLIDISSRKTNQGHAVLTMSDLIKKLRGKYDFLKNVEIKDTRFLELDEPVTVMSAIDKVGPDNVGKALYDIIKTMNYALGEDAGHFFVKELKNNMNDEYLSTIEEMGLDLGVIQLEVEVEEMTRKL